MPFININKSFININKSFINFNKCSFCPLWPAINTSLMKAYFGLILNGENEKIKTKQ